MFLSGRITGPRTTAAPPAGASVSRLRAAIEAILYHEVALALSFAIVAALTLGGDNLTGLATFAILWVMRLSAKLNVYLGVRNLAEEMLPAHLAYLETYFRRGPMNLLMPVSLAAGLIAAGFVLNATWRGGADGYRRRERHVDGNAHHPGGGGAPFDDHAGLRHRAVALGDGHRADAGRRRPRAGRAGAMKQNTVESGGHDGL